MDALQDALFWIGMAAFAALVGWQLFHVSRSEEVGRVEAVSGPFGWHGESATIRVRRKRGFSRHPRIVLMLHKDGLRVLVFSASEARHLARLIEEALTGAHARATAKTIGEVRGITIGLPRQGDGVGWISLVYGHYGEPPTCLAAAPARALAEMLRLASEPGGDLESARRAYRRTRSAAPEART